MATFAAELAFFARSCRSNLFAREHVGRCELQAHLAVLWSLLSTMGHIHKSHPKILEVFGTSNRAPSRAAFFAAMAPRLLALPALAWRGPRAACEERPPRQKPRVVVVGAGLTGCLTAALLRRPESGRGREGRRVRDERGGFLENREGE